jgi:hypothetical protein
MLILLFIFKGGRKGQGKEVGTSFHLKLENLGSCIFLQVGACKSGSWCILPVGTGKFWKLVLPVDVIFLYIKKCFVVFSHLGFHVKLLCIVHLRLNLYDILNATISLLES